MNRTDLQLLAVTRVADAEVLLREGRWAGAYYLLGYAVECGLKACVARKFRQEEVPDKALVNDFYTHRSDKLLHISDIREALDLRLTADARFRVNWNNVRDWTENSRYDHLTTEETARDLFLAVTDPRTGVLSWLKAWW
jgi:hypothetical protein